MGSITRSYVKTEENRKGKRDKERQRRRKGIGRERKGRRNKYYKLKTGH